MSYPLSRTLRRPAAVVLVLTLAPAAFAGHVYTFDVQDRHAGGEVERHEMAIEGKNLKMTNTSGDPTGGDFIFRGDRRQLLFLDPEAKTYFQIDKAAARTFGEALGGGEVGAPAGHADYLKDALSQLDPEQRQQIEQYLGAEPADAAGGGGELRLEASSTRAEQGGYPALRWDAYRGDEKIMELWVTEWSTLQGGAEVRRTFEDFAGFWGELVDAGLPSDDFEVLEAMARVKGFPVSIRLLDARQRVSVSWQLRHSEPKVLLLDEFEPKGYTRQPMPGGS